MRPFGNPCVRFIVGVLLGMAGLAATAAGQPEPERTPNLNLPVTSLTAGVSARRVDGEPYIRWKSHTAGSAAEALVHVRFTVRDPETRAVVEVREGSGFVARCDGFVMVPAGLVRPVRKTGSAEVPLDDLKEKSIVLTFASGDGETPPPQNVFHPRFYNPRVDFALAKVDGHHLKGLRTLAPENVREGMAVEVVYARLRGDGSVAEFSTEATVGAAEKGGKRYAFAGAPLRVPPGAVVVDREFGLAVGIVPGTASGGAEPPAAPAFATFADLPQVSNAVPLLRDPSTVVEEQTGSASEREGMVWVPGGPVALSNQTLRDYMALYGVEVACTPGFWIDKREVTNAEYREFLLTTGYRPLPERWDLSDLRNPLRRPADLPVTGVRPRDAAAYAAWRGKRLVSPVEWCLATRTASGAQNGLLTQFQRDAEAGIQALLTLDQAEELEIRAAMAETRRRDIAVQAAVIVRTPRMEEISRTRMGLFNTFIGRWGIPSEPAPAGWREGDVSMYGVRDVAMNIPELLLPNPAHRPVEIGWKPLPARHEPAPRRSSDLWNVFWPYASPPPWRIAPKGHSMVDGHQRDQFFQHTPVGRGFRCAR